MKGKRFTPEQIIRIIKESEWASKTSIYAGNPGYKSRRFIDGRAGTAAWK
jgi:hypothetical protein